MSKNLIATQHVVTAEESARLSALAGKLCPLCAGDLSVGDDEAAGFCGSCYDTANAAHE